MLGFGSFLTAQRHLPKNVSNTCLASPVSAQVLQLLVLRDPHNQMFRGVPLNFFLADFSIPDEGLLLRPSVAIV